MANLIAPTASWVSKPLIRSPNLLPVGLRFQFADDGHLVLADSGSEDVILVSDGDTQVLTDGAGSARRVASLGSRIIAY